MLTRRGGTDNSPDGPEGLCDFVMTSMVLSRARGIRPEWPPDGGFGAGAGYIRRMLRI